MEGFDKSEKARLKKARRRVAEVKGFYVHLMVYALINTTILLIKIVGTSYYGETFMGPIWHFSTLLPWLPWGIGLAFHASKVFGFIPFLGQGWEERQIEKFIEQEKREVKKFKD